MQHLEEGTIHAWLDGALSTTEAREVEQHVAECAECSAMVAEARGLIAGASRVVSSLDVVRGNVIPKAPAARGGKSVWRSLHLTPTRAALAATLLLAVSTLLTVRHDTPSKRVPDSRVVDSRIPASQPAPATVNAPVAAEAPKVGAPPTETRTSGARSTLAAQTKDRPPVVNEVVRDTVTNALDTSEKKVLAKADVRVDSARMEMAPRARSMQALRVIDNMTILPACFEFAGQSPSNLPRRFALQTQTGDTARHIIRAVTEDGRIDSVLVGSNWTRTTPTEITVRFASNDQALTLPIRDAASGVAAAVAQSQRRNFAPQSMPSVNRVACQP